VGELKILGYSAYLHPAGDGRLVGVGQDATERGVQTGTQVSLFDVSDPARPSRLATHQVPSGYSTAETDPHAFLYWPATGLLVVPVAAPDPYHGNAYTAGALALSLQGRTLGDLGTLVHPTRGPGQSMPDAISRALVIGDTLWTVSDGGLMASDAQSLTRRAWLPVT
jgi:hypothetical protein